MPRNLSRGDLFLQGERYAQIFQCVDIHGTEEIQTLEIITRDFIQ